MTNETKVLDQVSDTSRIYEVGYHLVPVIAEERVADHAAEIKALITKNNGVVVSEEAPKLTDLAYSISKMVDGQKIKATKAYFGSIKFEMEPEAALVLKKELDAQEKILRFLLITTVRENTMIDQKLIASREEGKASDAAAEEAAEKAVAAEKAEAKAVAAKKKAEVSEEELDKTIEGLL